MKQTDKQAISAALKEYCDLKGSQNAAAASLRGVSSATVSQILNNNWSLIRDEMWRNIASQIGYTGRRWVIVRTRGFNRMTDILTDAKGNSLVFAVTGEAGCGKSESIKTFAREQRNVYHLCCCEYWNRRDFMEEMLSQLAVQPTGYSLSGMMREIISTVKRRENPLIILDEADKLPDRVLKFFITLYNDLEDRCGLVLCATNFLEKRIRRGVTANRMGYNEIYSRIGRKFIPVDQVNAEDIEAVCRANGVEDGEVIDRIIDECDWDLRRVRRLVHADRKRREA